MNKFKISNKGLLFITQRQCQLNARKCSLRSCHKYLYYTILIKKTKSINVFIIKVASILHINSEIN